MEKYEYLKPNRLSDILGLISVLSIDSEWAYRPEESLRRHLNGSPKSANSWFEIAEAHPELFRINSDKKSLVLLVRFLRRTKDGNNVIFPPLSIEDTKSLIEQAISLHEKQQNGRFQRNSFYIPVATALIAAFTTSLVAFFTIRNTNNPVIEIDKKVEKVSVLINSIKVEQEKQNLKLDSLLLRSK
jgi:hypothetical protein